jgi:gliding motility-associated-like protein
MFNIKKYIFFVLIFFFKTLIVNSQVPTVQDCLGAIPICQNSYTTSNSYVGPGNYSSEINIFSSSCLSSGGGENNSVWYTFTSQTSGNFNFEINPNDVYDDYDWAVYNLTSANCADIYNNLSLEISCNSYGSNVGGYNGSTGASNAQGGTTNSNGPGDLYGPPWNASIPVVAGGTYVIMIDNWSSSQNGYNINFNGSTAVIFDNIPPHILSVNNQIACGASSLTLNFSENILCSTAQILDFTLTGPGGPYTITAITGAACSIGGIQENTFTINVSPAIVTSGTYSLNLVTTSGSVTDLCGNIAPAGSLDFNINAVSATVSVVNSNCGQSNGTATVIPTGGTGSYSYLWNTIPSQSTATCTGLAAGTYSVTVTSGSCNVVNTVLVNNIGGISAGSFSNNTPDYCENVVGSVTVNFSDGLLPFNYLWNTVPVQNTQTASGLSAGNYSVTVTDANGCSSISNTAISSTSPLTFVSSKVDVLCYGGNNGTATINVTSGVGPFVYNWSGGVSITNVATSLTAGNYNVTITDANACSASGSIVITQPTQINIITQSLSNATCFGLCNGSISVNTSGGTPGYNYLWPNASVLSSLSNLCAGTYIVTVTDANSCTLSHSVLITQPLALSASITNVINPLCSGSCNGSATVVSINGTSPYTYLWSSGSVSNNSVGLCSGNYIVTVTDGNSCTVSTSLTLIDPAVLTVSVSDVYPVNCYGGCDGSATINVIGGLQPYSYGWITGTVSSQTNNTLCAGNYIVTVTDASQCSSVTNVLITQPVVFAVTNFTKVNVSCFGLQDGSIDFDVVGGIAPYTYSIGSQNSSESFFVGLGYGNYILTVTDANNCTATIAFAIEQPQLIVLSSPTSYTICEGEHVMITPTIIGGTPGYTWYWNGTVNTGSSIDVSPLVPSVYSVSVTDSKGCTSNSVTISVDLYKSLEIDVLSSQSSICPGESVQLNVTFKNGGGPPYIIFNQQGMILVPPISVTPNNSGYIYMYVKDACNILVHDSVFVTVNPSPVVTFVSDKVEGCEPLLVAFNPSPIQTGYSYYWNFGDASYNAISYSTNPIHQFTQDGIFNVLLTVTSSQGCSSTFLHPQMINVWPAPDARFISLPATASIVKPQVLFTNQSEFASTYVWSFGDGDSSGIENPMHWYPALGSYVVYLVAITDKGCKDTVNSVIEIRDEYTFYAPSAISPDFDDINDVFYVLGNGISTEGFHLYIFDRWGSIIYETENYSSDQPAKSGWDGSFQNGAIVPVGSYTWFVKYFDGDNIRHEKSGVVNVVR